MDHSNKPNYPDKKIWELTGNYKASFQPNEEEALRRFRKRLQATPAGRNSRIRRMRPWSVAAAILVLIGVSYFLFGPVLSQQSPQIVRTASGQQIDIRLDDGSLVWLNASSRLWYPEHFSDPERVVELRGQAYFDVAKDAFRPFVIKTAMARVEVLGTRFDLKEDSLAGLTRLSLLEGRVRFSSLDGTAYKEIEAGQRIELIRTEDGYQLRLFKLETENAVSWRTGELEFENAPLLSVIKDLEEHYTIQIEIDGNSLASCSFTTRFRQTPLPLVFETLERVFGCKVTETRSGHFRISGGGC